MDKRGVIIITHRNRQVHLDCLLLYLDMHFSQYPVIVAHQDDSAVWNKGLLYNTAFLETGKGYDYMILHDVDFIPNPDVDYSYTPNPTLISTECSQFGYGQCYPTFFGGVIGISKEHYEQVNGFSNSFRGWGGEDDEMFRRFVGKGIPTFQRAGNRFENFIHPRLDVRPQIGTDWNNPDYQHNWKLVHRQPDYTDGLSTARYKLNCTDIDKNVTHLYIDTTHG